MSETLKNGQQQNEGSTEWESTKEVPFAGEKEEAVEYADDFLDDDEMFEEETREILEDLEPIDENEPLIDVEKELSNICKQYGAEGPIVLSYALRPETWAKEYEIPAEEVEEYKRKAEAVLAEFNSNKQCKKWLERIKARN